MASTTAGISVGFQSTPPARGGDLVLYPLAVFLMGISIHAPREGGRRGGETGNVPLRGISIHAPREGGRLRSLSTDGASSNISIHAPREGGRLQRCTVLPVNL